MKFHRASHHYTFHLVPFFSLLCLGVDLWTGKKSQIDNENHKSTNHMTLKILIRGRNRVKFKIEIILGRRV